MKKIEISKDLLMIAGILAVLVIFFYKFVFLGMIPLNAEWLSSNFYPWKALDKYVPPAFFNNDTDPVLYMYPIKYITIQIMKGGHLPLWNPYILCGAPLWGNNFSCPLNPLNIVFFIFNFATAWGIFLMLQFAVAGLSMYVLSRELGSNRLGAAISALAYMLNTTFVIWFQTLSYLGVFCWLPLVFYLIEKTAKNKSLITAFWCGVSFALFVWSGQIQLAAYCVFFSFVYLLFKMCRSAIADQGNLKRYFTAVLIVVGAAFLYSLPEILVQKTNLVNSTRTPGRYGVSLLYPQMLVSYISPYFYGMKYDGWDLGFGTYIFNRGLIRLSPPYIGILPIFLAVIGFVSRKDRDKYLFLLSSVGIIACLMAFALPIVYKPILKFIPFFASVDHYRLTTIYVFSMSIMSGWGATALFGANAEKRSFKRIATATFLVIVLVFIGLSIISGIDAKSAASSLTSLEKKVPSFLFDGSHSLKSFYRFIEYLNMLVKDSGSLLFSKEAFMPIAFSLLSALIIVCLSRFGSSRILLSLAFIFVAFDLLYYGLKFPAYSDRASIFPKTPSAKFLANDKSLYRVVGYSGRDAYPKGDAYPPNTGMVYGLYDVRGYENLAQVKWYYRFIMGDRTDEIVVEKFNDYENKILDLLNVKYLLSKEEIRSDKWRLVQDKDVNIYENAAFMPRAVLEGSSPAYPEIRSYGPNEISIDTGGDSSGVLLLSDTYFPGWKAYVDGCERVISMANGAFRAVGIKKGDRNVRFLFKPAGVYESLYICAGLLVFMIGFSIYAKRTC